MGQYIVFADILLALNFFCDFFLLWAAGRILRRNIVWWRIIAAAVLGALYGLSAVIPSISWLTHPFCMVVISLLLLRIAYAWDSPKSFLKLAGVFYLTAFAMGGAALAGQRLLELNGLSLAPMQTLKWGSLLFALFIAVLLGRRGWNSIRKNWKKEDFALSITIIVAGRSCTMPALIDTGNDLLEPISGLPVIVADYQALRSILPQYLREAFTQHGHGHPELVMEQIANHNNDGWLKRLRLIPFASIGKQNGLMLGFKPDKLLLKGESNRQTSQVMVCISLSPLGNGYQAIVNPEIMNGNEKFKEAC